MNFKEQQQFCSASKCCFQMTLVVQNVKFQSDSHYRRHYNRLIISAYCSQFLFAHLPFLNKCRLPGYKHVSWYTRLKKSFLTHPPSQIPSLLKIQHCIAMETTSFQISVRIHREVVRRMNPSLLSDGSFMIWLQ